MRKIFIICLVLLCMIGCKEKKISKIYIGRYVSREYFSAYLEPGFKIITTDIGTITVKADYCPMVLVSGDSLFLFSSHKSSGIYIDRK